MFDMILEQGFNYILSDKETFNDKSRSINYRKVTGMKLWIIL